LLIFPFNHIIDLFSSPNILMTKSRKIGEKRNVSTMVERKGACGVLVGNPERKNSLGQPRHLW
jgi:hypothetical protein